MKRSTKEFYPKMFLNPSILTSQNFHCNIKNLVIYVFECFHESDLGMRETPVVSVAFDTQTQYNYLRIVASCHYVMQCCYSGTILLFTTWIDYLNKACFIILPHKN